jgi:drug/metabolite transporter (DMT)-like permease
MNNIAIVVSYACCWGVCVTLTKLTLSGIPTATLIAIQLLTSVLFLTTIYTFKYRQFPFSSKSFKQGSAGIFDPALSHMFGIFGLKMTTASNATLILASEVILTIILAAVFFGEKLTRIKLLLAGTSFAGIMLLMLTDAEGGSHASVIGDLLVFLGNIFAVVYVLLSKKQIGGADPLQLTASQQLVGLITIGFCFQALSTIDPIYKISLAGISPKFWLLAVGSGILQALAFLFYLTALQTVSVSQAAFYLSLIPVFGVTSAIIIIGEQPNSTQWIGAGLVIISAYFANQLEAEAK